jgi:hypothetical protein
MATIVVSIENVRLGRRLEAIQSNAMRELRSWE